MDNTEAKTTEQKAGSTTAIIFVVALVAGIAFLIWRGMRQRKIDATMRRVREAKANKNELENVGSPE